MRTRDKIIYWIATVWLSLGMIATGMLQLTKQYAEGAIAPPGVWGIKQLGYPVYFLTIIGVWKIFGAIAILVPKFPLLKEWSYAGFFFLLSGGIFSHIAVGSPPGAFIPSSFLLVLTVLSWYFRPASKKT